MKRNKPYTLLNKAEPYLWILPSIILMFIFIIIPIGFVFRMAFSQVTKAGLVKGFIGFKNFEKVLGGAKFAMVLKSREEIFSPNGTIFPKVWLWSNFTDIFECAPMAQYMLNSILIADGSTAIAMVCGIPAAYALARMKFKGQTAFLGFIIVSQMFAPVVLLIGIYKVMQTMALTNTLLGLIFINAAFNQAFTIWLLRGTFMSISAEMEQAATIDGCNRVQAMFKILLPVAAPGIVTTLIFIFINAWNEYTVALCLISTDTIKPLTVGINIFNGYNIIEWQYLFAASIFAIVPVVILFMSIEKNLTSGLTAGGVKG